MKIQICKLVNPIQNYDWGSGTFLAHLTNHENIGNKPQAELWMGAHKSAPSLVCDGHNRIPLHEWIQMAPEKVLGAKTLATFGKKLPFLFKVLAADKPLSIQAHPNLEQAQKGFEKENSLGISLSARNRNYRDANHKPELICALTPFLALRGFVPFAEIVLNFRAFIRSKHSFFSTLEKVQTLPEEQQLASFFHALMTLDKKQQSELFQACEEMMELSFFDELSPFALFAKLRENYGDDIGVLAPLYLQIVQLQPGEAMYLPAGELHSYLHGAGIEIMANSDNVLRGGCTSKHVDVAELINVLNFQSNPIEILQAQESNSLNSYYQTPSSEFQLSFFDVSEQKVFENKLLDAFSILLCVEGKAKIVTPEQTIKIYKGESVVIPACNAHYKITGNARFYRSSVPL